MNPLVEEAQKLVFEARVRAKYHGFVEHRYSRIDQRVRITIAIASIVATGLVFLEHPKMSAGLMFATAILAIVSSAAIWRDLANEHAKARAEAFRMRRLAECAEVEARLSKTETRERLEEAYLARNLVCMHFEIDSRLMEKARMQVEHEMDLPKPAPPPPRRVDA